MLKLRSLTDTWWPKVLRSLLTTTEGGPSKDSFTFSVGMGAAPPSSAVLALTSSNLTLPLGNQYDGMTGKYQGLGTPTLENQTWEKYQARRE
jgi:hypothetical protein